MVSPRKSEEDFPGGKSKSIWGHEQLAHLLPKQPDSASSSQAPGAEGEEIELRQGQERGLTLLEVPSSPASHLSLLSFPNLSLCS